MRLLLVCVLLISGCATDDAFLTGGEEGWFKVESFTGRDTFFWCSTQRVEKTIEPVCYQARYFKSNGRIEAPSVEPKKKAATKSNSPFANDPLSVPQD